MIIILEESKFKQIKSIFDWCWVYLNVDTRRFRQRGVDFRIPLRNNTFFCFIARLERFTY